MSDFAEYIDSKSLDIIKNWEKEFNVRIIVVTPSKTRMGVFIPKRDSKNLEQKQKRREQLGRG